MYSGYTVFMFLKPALLRIDTALHLKNRPVADQICCLAAEIYCLLYTCLLACLASLYQPSGSGCHEAFIRLLYKAFKYRACHSCC